jgi:hypothetical protein
MPDSVLDFLVVLLPFALSVVGIWTFEPVSQQHKWTWRVGLIVVGAIFSVLTYAQQGRQRAKTASDARELEEQLIRQAQASNQRVSDLKQNFNALSAESLSQKRSAAIVLPKCPTAEELADEVDKRLSSRLSPNPKNLTADKPPVPTKPTPTPVPMAVDPATTRPCRGDHLDECSDEDLLEWGSPLVANIEDIHNQYMADIKKLDDIKGGRADWLRELTGVGGDKDSKFLKGFELANRSATEHFRDCCAERAIVYHKELLQRDQKRSDNVTLYEWVQELLKPANSKEWKKAQEDGSKVGDVYFDLDFFQIDLNYLVSVRRIGH